MNLWEDLKFEITVCERCKLCNARKNTVIGEGDENSPIMFIGEAPGEEEDLQGCPFVGASGSLFTKIFNSVKLERKDVYITNIVKCRPPRNRNPEEEEIESCSRYLDAQIALINPKLIVTVGAVSSKYFLKENMKKGIMSVRGQEFEWEGGIKIIPILHPSYLLRNPSTEEGKPKWLTWQDMKKIKNMYDEFMEI